MINRISAGLLAAILGIFSLAAFGGTAYAGKAKTSQDGTELIEEPSDDATSSAPATSTDSKGSGGNSSHHHRGDSIDDGAEGG